MDEVVGIVARAETNADKIDKGRKFSMPMIRLFSWTDVGAVVGVLSLFGVLLSENGQGDQEGSG